MEAEDLITTIDTSGRDADGPAYTLKSVEPETLETETGRRRSMSDSEQSGDDSWRPEGPKLIVWVKDKFRVEEDPDDSQNFPGTFIRPIRDLNVGDTRTVTEFQEELKHQSCLGVRIELDEDDIRVYSIDANDNFAVFKVDGKWRISGSDKFTIPSTMEIVIIHMEVSRASSPASSGLAMRLLFAGQSV
eukprot:GHVU01056238.1.p2 GENE.GHVU01056238.1~~GHVU01056238.1.p2  ORF type:complete len:189 (-),score=22.70 GHVU01056238.1:752-1318(-)